MFDRDPLSLLQRVEKFVGAPHFDFSIHAREKVNSYFTVSGNRTGTVTVTGTVVVRRTNTWIEWMVSE